MNQWNHRGALIESAVLIALRQGPQSLFRLQQSLEPTSITGVFRALNRLRKKRLIERLPEKHAGELCPRCGHRESKKWVYRLVVQQQRMAS